jgi:hypothetical protein
MAKAKRVHSTPRTAALKIVAGNDSVAQQPTLTHSRSRCLSSASGRREARIRSDD